MSKPSGGHQEQLDHNYYNFAIRQNDNEVFNAVH
jgi:hypothetical protein